MNDVQVAFENVRIVVINARMTGPEHDQLKQDFALIAKRCQRADELEKQKVANGLKPFEMKEVKQDG